MNKDRAKGAEVPVKLYTSRWQNRDLERLDVVPVGISRGAPKFPVRYRYRRLPDLYPDGWMFAIEDDDRFERAYRAKLERIGAEKIAGLLRGLSDEEGGKPLALLCYEDVHAGQVCHRRMFAEWFEEKVGQEVPELEGGHAKRGLRQMTLWDGEGSK